VSNPEEYTAFRSVEGIRNALVEEIAAVPGVGEKKAEEIKQAVACE